jgi:Zn-dependent protease
VTQSQTERPARAGISISPNALLLFGGFIAIGWALAAMANPPAILVFLFVAVGWIVSVVVHEFGHAFIAWKAGDTSVAEKGYLTLDPLKYSDVGVTIVLPLIALLLGGIGFPGAAVYIRHDLIRSRLGRALTSLAGPVGTLLVLLGLAAVLSRLWTGEATPLVGAIAVLAFLQATALILNLLPVPGLDGYGVIRPFLPASAQVSLRKWESGAFLILFLLIFFVPGASHLLFGGALEICRALGVPVRAIAQGWAAFQFWR